MTPKPLIPSSNRSFSATDPLGSYRRLCPGPTERGFLVGKTGSGKTTLAKRLVKVPYHCLAIDPKISLGSVAGNASAHLSGFALCRTPEELVSMARQHARIQYRPDPDFQEPEDYEVIYRWVYDRKNTFVYTDEVLLVSRGREVPDSMRACVTSGRERGIGMLHGTQRPALIDGRLLSESEHFYVFSLQKEADRRRMGEMMNPCVVDEPAVGHDFWYQGPNTPARLLRLEGI